MTIKVLMTVDILNKIFYSRYVLFHKEYLYLRVLHMNNEEVVYKQDMNVSIE